MSSISLRRLMVAIALTAVGLAVIKNSGRPLFVILTARVLRMIGERILGASRLANRGR